MPKKENLKVKPIVYSALEVANLCGVVNQTAINWIKNGFLKAFKTPGGQFRVYPKDLLDFMKHRNMIIPQKVINDCSEIHNQKKQKLLIVDDDESFNNVIKKFLESKNLNLEIFQAFDGFEAGSIMAQKKPKFLVLDLDLPGINGIKLCHKIKESEILGSPEIFIVTALQDEKIEKECLALGIKKYFKKPLSLQKLLEAIEEFI